MSGCRRRAVVWKQVDKVTYPAAQLQALILSSADHCLLLLGPWGLNFLAILPLWLTHTSTSCRSHRDELRATIAGCNRADRGLAC